MENDMHYFKRPTLGGYVKVAFFRFIMYVLLAISIAIGLKLFFWWIGKSSPNAIYYIMVTYFITREFKNFDSLYRRMQEVPFITLTKEEICIDRSMAMFPKASAWSGKIELKWSAIQHVKTGRDSFTIYFRKNGKGISEKANLRWVQNIEDLLETLKNKCQQESITWTE
ncbi:MAG: hypothetical protein PVF58_20950 [Candidatus Methanofastidiosia archaeon]|jgi:hypothetical protein